MKWLQSLPIYVIMLLLLLMMALPAIGLIAYTELHDRETDLQESTRASSYLLNNIATALIHEVKNTEQLMTMLSLLPEVRQRHSDSVNRLLADILSKNNYFANIVIVDRAGESWASAVPSDKPMSYGDRKAFKDAIATGRFSSGEYQLGSASRKPIINFALPLKDSNDAISGAILFSINLEQIGSLLKADKLPSGTSFGVFDHKGTFIYRTIDPGKFIGGQDKPDLFERMKNGPEEGQIDLISNDGMHRVSAYRKIRLYADQPPYAYIRGGTPIDIATREANITLVRNLIAMTVLLVMVFTLTMWFSKRLLVNRIVSLHNASRRLASGDLTVRVAHQVAGGELGKLGHAFDEMAEALAGAIAERERKEEAIRERELRYRTLFDKATDGILILDGDGRIIDVNNSFASVHGYTLDELHKMNLKDLDTPETTEHVPGRMKRLKAGEALEFEVEHFHKSGTVIALSVAATRIELDGLPCVIGFHRDITDRKRAEDEKKKFEQQLLSAQKLESLGVLAGGVAHDFNNILTAIIGNTELALMKLNAESPIVGNLYKIQQSAARAADIAKQMLAYSGKGKYIVDQINLNRLLEEMLHLLEVSIAKKTVLRLNMQTPIPTVLVDVSQMRQIITNMVINASEAIGEQGGMITLSTGSITCDRDCLKDVRQGENMAEGEYVWMEVADTGCGMDEEIVSKIFDPFFTTKFTGRGLGLAAVLGIVRGHHGAIKVRSEQGKGSVFTVLLPSSGN